MTILHEAPLVRLDPVTLYEILRLRVDVFVVEQNCPYPELDGRDAEATTLLLWATDDTGRVIATLRLLTDAPTVRRIGRVATAETARGAGVAAALVQRAIEVSGTAEIVLDAQSHLQAWYERFGFVRDGDEFLEDGIPHIPMRRTAENSGV